MPFTVDWDLGGDDEKRRSGSTSSSTSSISLQRKKFKRWFTCDLRNSGSAVTHSSGLLRYMEAASLRTAAPITRLTYR